jgi:hypothetical protein
MVTKRYKILKAGMMVMFGLCFLVFNGLLQYYGSRENATLSSENNVIEYRYGGRVFFVSTRENFIIRLPIYGMGVSFAVLIVSALRAADFSGRYRRKSGDKN